MNTVVGERKIIHVDMDCFFAAVEMRRQPVLASQPLAIGRRQPRSVVATCNYVARRYGIHSAMPVTQALQRCPSLVLLPGDMALYRQVSAQVRQIFLRYSDKVEMAGLDEAYLDVSDQPSATRIAQAIRRDIRLELGLTASAGVAPCKFLAKIVAAINKPDGLFVLPPERVDAFLRPLPVSRLPGVGKITAGRLAQLGIGCCEDLRRQSVNVLTDQFGRFGRRLWHYAHGRDERAVEVQRQRKSVSVEMTWLSDLVSEADCLARLDALLPALAQRLHRAGVIDRIGQLQVKVKFADFSQHSLTARTTAVDKALASQLLMRLLRRYPGQPVRLLGLGVRLLPARMPCQLSLAL